MAAKEKFYNIEFLRLCGMISILLFHFNILMAKHFEFTSSIALYQSVIKKTALGSIWVDFFFIISGFVLFYTLDVKTDFLAFVKKRLIRLLPVIWFCGVLYFVLAQLHWLDWRRYINVFTFFLLNNVGLTQDMGNLHPTWYVSVLFWTGAFYFYLVKMLKREYFNFVTALLVFFSYIFLANSSGFAPHVEYHFINAGLLHGLGGLGLGYFIYVLYTSLPAQPVSSQAPSLLSKMGYTLAEGYLLFNVVYFSILRRTGFGRMHLLLILYFAILLYLFIVKKGFLSTLLNRNIFIPLSKYTYAVYVGHVVIYDLIYKNIWQVFPQFIVSHPLLNLLLPLVLSVVAGVLLYHYVEVPAVTWFKKLSASKNPEERAFLSQRGGGG